MLKYSRNKDIKTSKSKNLEGTSKLTTMLLINSFFFLLTTLPIVSYFYLAKQRDIIVWASVRAVNLLNYSCNFFIYLLSGKKFRDEAKSYSTADVGLVPQHHTAKHKLVHLAFQQRVNNKIF